MKSVFVILSLILPLTFASTAAHAEVKTVCGIFRTESSDGMLTVMRNLLYVPSGPMTPAFEVYELAAAGETFSEVQEASLIIDSLEIGKSYCLKGEVYQKPNYDMVLIPESIEPVIP